jgi:hypothetical protein
LNIEDATTQELARGIAAAEAVFARAGITALQVDTIIRRLTIPTIMAAFDGSISNIDKDAELQQGGESPAV